MWWFTQKPCQVCIEKEFRLQDLTSQILMLKGQLAHSREREEKAVDTLLGQKGAPPVTPNPRMTFKDAEDQQRQAFGMFLDEDDKGDGNILEVDRLNVERSPLL